VRLDWESNRAGMSGALPPLAKKPVGIDALRDVIERVLEQELSPGARLVRGPD